MSEPTKSLTLAEAYPLEQERLRELIKDYEAIGPFGAYGALHIRDVLRRADVASASQDTVAMLRAYEAMKDCE